MHLYLRDGSARTIVLAATLRYTLLSHQLIVYLFSVICLHIFSFFPHSQPQVPLVNSAVNVWPEYTLTEERYLSLERVPRVDDHLFGKRVALWTDLLPSLYNSTQEPEPVVYRTRHQQQRQPWGCRSPAWRKMARGVAKTFTFNGGLTHPKLP